MRRINSYGKAVSIRSPYQEIGGHKVIFRLASKKKLDAVKVIGSESEAVLSKADIAKVSRKQVKKRSLSRYRTKHDSLDVS